MAMTLLALTVALLMEVRPQAFYAVW